MRILHVTPYYAPAWVYGGVVSAVSGLATTQAARQHHVTVLTTDTLSGAERNPHQREVIAGVEVIRCRNVSNTLRAHLNLSSPVGFRRAFRQLVAEADIVHVHELRTIENLLITSHQPNKPIVLSSHGTLAYETGRSTIKQIWDRLFGSYLARRIDHIAALTLAEADESRTLWHTLNVTFPGVSVIPNGVPTDFGQSVAAADDLRSRYGLGSDPVVLFLGRLHERKGLQFLIPAVARANADLLPEYPQARMLIVGPDEGMLISAQKLAVQSGISDRVTFTGLLTGADRLAAFKTADIFALPAVGEGLSMAALEAMAAELPLILTPGCNLPELETRGAGLIVERQVGPLSTALGYLLRAPDRRREMGEQGRSWLEQAFTWPVIAAQTEALYSLAVSKRANSHYLR